MLKNNYDIAIVGGGIIGLSTAYVLQKKFPFLNLLVLEKESELAFHQTGRNSGVIHSGLYYKPGSQRSLHCIKGRKQLISFARNHDVKFDVCGKLVVATNEEEVERLSDLKINGAKNSLDKLELLDRVDYNKIEPYIQGKKALWVPHSGIIDYKDFTNKLYKNIIALNSQSKIITSCKVLDYKNDIITSKGIYSAKHIIFCGGLFADRLAQKDGAILNMQTVGFRGDYYKLANHAKYKIKNLVYPVPNPKFPFLGVHFTRTVSDDIECGPNAVFTFKREGYKKFAFSFRDSYQALTFKGTWKLFINNWKFGLDEYKKAFVKYLFLKELQKIVPSLEMKDIIQSRSGVRAIALSDKGELIDDFRIVNTNNNIHVLNAPSPAATSCLAIAETIMERTKKEFNL